MMELTSYWNYKLKSSYSNRNRYTSDKPQASNVRRQHDVRLVRMYIELLRSE